MTCYGLIQRMKGRLGLELRPEVQGLVGAKISVINLTIGIN